MAFGQGFAGGYADLLEAPPRHHGGGGRPRARYRLEPWAPPKPPELPPKPEPVRIRVSVHVTCSMSARVTGLAGKVTIPGPRFGGRARLVGPPLLVALHDLDVRSRRAEDLAELGLSLGFQQQQRGDRLERQLKAMTEKNKVAERQLKEATKLSKVAAVLASEKKERRW